MILIFLSWLYILFTTLNWGVALDKIGRLRNQNFAITVFLGLFSVTVLGSIWAIFSSIAVQFHLFLLFANGFLFIRFYKEIRQLYRHFILEFIHLTKGLKLFLLITTILGLAQCATTPYILDNEIYYIQTIKWLNQYGFVKGLGNFNYLLAQTSGWHITQSAFNFSFLYPNFNDLNGFCLLVGNFFCIGQLQQFLSDKKRIRLIVGLLPITNVLLFQFINAPSPDLPIYILSFILFFLFIENYENPTLESFSLIVILTLFSLYIKPISFAIIGLPVILFFKNSKLFLSKSFLWLGLSSIIFALFIIKNLLLSGYPFFPVMTVSFPLDYTIPKPIIDFYLDEKIRYGFFLLPNELEQLNRLQIFIKWCTFSAIDGFFNVVSIILVFTCPFILYRHYNQKKYWFIYGIMLVQCIALLFTSPQFRFFIPYIFFFSFLWVAPYIKTIKKPLFLLYINAISIVIVLCFAIKLSILTTNKEMMYSNTFSPKNVLLPNANSKLKTRFQNNSIGNLQYYSPDKNTYFWSNGQGDIPCINSQQINFFKDSYHYIPQLRTRNIKDGFYAKKTKP